jgi:hypothetical protein
MNTDPVATHEGTMVEVLQPRPGAALLGWIDGHLCYLLPDAAYRLAFSSLQ